MLSNFKTWIHNTAVSMVDETSSLTKLNTTIKQNTPNNSHSISTSDLNGFTGRLKLDNNLNNSASAVLIKNNLVKSLKSSMSINHAQSLAGGIPLSMNIIYIF